MYYYNNEYNRIATECEVALYTETEDIMMMLNDDDYIFILDTIKGYISNNGFNDYDDILDIVVKHNISVSQLLTWYMVDLVY